MPELNTLLGQVVVWFFIAVVVVFMADTIAKLLDRKLFVSRYAIRRIDNGQYWADQHLTHRYWTNPIYAERMGKRRAQILATSLIRAGHDVEVVLLNKRSIR